MRSLVPPPDPSVEMSMTRALRRALDAYVALERRVQDVASGSCAPACAACRNPCCKSAFCEEAWTTPWLRAATSRAGARRDVAAGQAIEGHLARDGCRLRWGRPPVCYEFACADVVGGLGGDDEKYLFRVISRVIAFAGEDALPGTHLVELTDLGRLGAPRVARLSRRIALAAKVFDSAVRLFRQHGHGLASDWDLVTKQFSPKGYELTRGAAPRGAAGLRRLPLVGALLAAGALALTLMVGGAACTTHPRLALAAPEVKSIEGRADEVRDGKTSYRFVASSAGICVTIRNLAADQPVVIDWTKASYIDRTGAKHAAIGFEHNLSTVLRQDPPEPLVIGPGEVWSGRVHPRDLIPTPSGNRFFAAPLLSGSELVPGAIVGLDLVVDGGAQPVSRSFRFKLTKQEVVSE